VNAAWLTADMAEAGSEALWRTNPVSCIDRLMVIWKRSDHAWLMSGSHLVRVITTLTEHDIMLPAGVGHRWAPGRQLPSFQESPEPRVIGLAVDGSRTGHVFPLRPTPANDPAALIEFARLYAASCRHHGRSPDAVSVGGEVYERVKKLRDLGCDDDEADAAAEYAASLFTAHQFAEIVPLLRPWAEMAATEPRRFRPLTRVKVWNTLARAMAITGEQGWEELFAQSEALQGQLGDSENLARTTHDRIHALLRHGDVVRAAQALEETNWSAQTTSVPWLPFLRADLARREGRAWSDAALDQRLADGEKPYAAWLYLQATARQPTREPAEAVRGLETVISLLRHEAGGNKGNICSFLAALLNLLSAARSKNIELWNNATAEARTFLSTAPNLQSYYGAMVDALPATPDELPVQALLHAVPYF
jgi:hypothetical protein